MSDDEIVALIEVARGYDRALLIEALGYSGGDSGPAYLRAALGQSGPGSTHRRTSPMRALATRLGADAVPDLVPQLTGGNLETQTAALWCIEHVDDGQASDAVVEWLRRRLRAKARANTYSTLEVPGVLLYALRVGTLKTVLALLEEERDLLQPEERRHLDRVWPPNRRSRYAQDGRPADGPDASAVEDWYRMGTTDLSDDEALADLQEWVGPVIGRLRKRLKRSSR